MVHALEQTHRVLRPHGLLADLRPNRFTDPELAPPALPRICGIADGGETPAGELTKSEKNLASHRAASRAVDEALRRGLYALESVETFPFRYYFRSVAVLDQYISSTWRETSLEAASRLRLEIILSLNPQARILIIDPLRLNILRKP